MFIDNNNLTVSIIGNSAPILFGANYTDNVYKSYRAKTIVEKIFNFLELNPSIRTTNINMSSGIGLLAGLAIAKYKIKYGHGSISLVCYMSGNNHKKGFSVQESNQYDLIMARVSDKVVSGVSTEENHTVRRARNIKMIEDSDILLSLWNGVSDNSLPDLAVKCGIKRDKSVYVIDPKDFDVEHLYHGSKTKPIRINSTFSSSVKELTPSEYLMGAYSSDM